jgi:arsenate reductase-like glutaredoxin family protein
VVLAVRDIFRQPLTVEEIRTLVARASVAQMFSWKSPTARQLGLVPGERSDDDLIDMMAREPRLIRRPITTTDRQMVVGADLKALAQIG